MPEVRVRFAPSPTGPLHIGGVRTALYNYLFARKQGGKMLLRLEDTDQNRFVPGAEAYILEALAWVGVQIDEGLGVGGPHGSYRQSERQEIYRQYAEKLIAGGQAYYAFDTPEALEAIRQAVEKQGSAFQYNAATRMRLQNALTLPADEVAARLAAGEPHVIRLRVPAKEDIRFQDLIRGHIVVHSSQIDDKVLLKADGMPTYHLANVVDDHLMDITHVIRGEEWLPSAPLHVLLYRAFGWQRPEFAHLPLLLKPEGNGKLSKRDADLGGFPVFPLQWTDPATGQVARGFREDGYLPEAVVNFLAFLGWNPGSEQEIFSMQQLIEAFELEQIHKGGARFDIAKARWLNQQYLRHISDDTLARQLLPELGGDLQRATQVVHLLKDRVSFPHEIVEQARFLAQPPSHIDEQLLAGKWNEQVAAVLADYTAQLPAARPFTAASAKELLQAVTEKHGIKMGRVMQPLRVALTGQAAGPDLMLSMEIMGPQATAERLNFALQHFHA